MTVPFPAVSDADSLILDTNVIVNFSRVAPGGVALDYLITDNTTAYVTLRVEQEVLDNREMTGLMQASYLQWAYSNYGANVELIDTGTPPGGNSGEQSIRDLLSGLGELLGHSVVLSGDYGEQFPGSSEVLDSAGLANSLLLSGEISYAEYTALTARLKSIAPHEFVDDVMLIPAPGSNVAYEVNGAIIQIRPNGLIVNGVHVGLTQTFEIDPNTGQVTVTDNARNILGIDHCFLADTSIRMWPLDPSIKPRADGSYDEELVLSKVWHKPIREIAVGDIVVAFDKQGRLQPDRVTRTMQNNATHILDFWGTGVTPGHACYCTDGPFKGGHAPLMDILRTDGAIMRVDGTMIRAATNCKVGSMGDRMIHAAVTRQKLDASSPGPKLGKLRFGTRIILSDGRDTSLMEVAQEEGWRVSNDGYMVGTVTGADGTVTDRVFFFPYCFGAELPRPEDYILKRSAVTLQEIYLANEWEQIGTRMPAPESVANVNPNSTMNQSKPKPNIPPAFANRRDVPIAERSARRPGSATALPFVLAK